MIYGKILPYLTMFIFCLLISIECVQGDWLEGGFVRSGDYGDIRQYFTDPIFYSPGSSYASSGPAISGKNVALLGSLAKRAKRATSKTETSVPDISLPDVAPYYSDFRLNSLAGMNWEPFQKNWSETMDYARTKGSFRSYPRPTATYPSVQLPATIATDTLVTILSQDMRGYQVFLDGTFIGTEGTGGDPLDGNFSFKVIGNQNHEIRVYDGQFNYPKTIYFQRGVKKIIYVEPGTAVYV